MDISKYDKERVYLVTHNIKTIRDSITDRELSKHNHFDWEKGARFNNTNGILVSMLHSIYLKCEMSDEKANKAFLSLNSAETEPLIRQALLSAAYTDHYYRHEKQYD